MQPGLVSVIIPTYNRAHLVADAIRSVLAQDYAHKQIIVVDDGSTDETRRIVEGFAGVEYHHQSNQGQAAARNAGLRHCRGEYVASLDSDDIWDPAFLSEGIGQLLPERSIVFMNWRTSNGNKGLESFFRRAAVRRRYLTRALGSWWHLDAAQTRRMVLEICPAPSSALIIRRSAMPGGWNEQMRIADDWCLLLDIVLHRPTAAAFTMAPHWLKRVQGDNIYDGRSHTAIAQELSAHDEPLLLRRHQGQLSRSEIAIFQQQQAEHYVNYAYTSYKHSEKNAMLRHLLAAFRLAPFATGCCILREVADYVKHYYAKSYAQSA
ncbi:glycosyltransferase family 2 protein [Hymenobacter sp. M29]|uniref:Glycosyltransferase family 2 protein n=1 Tax=Hymenobacter mellowenesis TaxID=3063995 RepID=A0ABT9A900_9BACT|nr:glycosyltransferase family 2 protein [Hymenobacter sp. M29]MDO7845897.1 glycosyltransferase family 2 protein [Hymenobacter sp. M29]